MSKIRIEYREFPAVILLPAFIFAGLWSFAEELAGGGILTALPIVAGIGAIILVEVSCRRPQKRTVIAAAAAIASIIYIGLTFTYFRAGLACTVNDIIESLKHIRPYNYIIFKTAVEDAGLAKTVFLSWLAAVAAAGISIAVRKGMRIPIAVCAAVWIFLTLTFSSILSTGVLVFSGAAIGLWIFHGAAYKGRREDRTILAGDRAILIRTLVIVLVTVISFNIFVPEAEYEKANFLRNAQSGITEAVEKVRYGGKSSGLTYGKLYKAGDMKRGDNTVLEVTMAKPDSYYLRGFVGASYEASQWKETDRETLFDNTDMFYWLHEGGFFGTNQLYNGAVITKSDTEPGSMTVKNIGASREYIYAPYELTDENEMLDVNCPGDDRIKTSGFTGDKEYTFSVSENLVRKYRQIALSLAQRKNDEAAQDYIKNESYYNEYVYENYTEMPAEISALLAEYLGDYSIAGGEDHFDYQMAKQNIMYFMVNKMKYSETSEATGKDVDFILNFLEGTKTGYDIHHASAAVMMFRYYGIPARYVEGYVVTKDDVENAKDGETVLLDATHAHAWAEYYHDGIGWLPFEATPAYFDVMPNPDPMQDISGLLGKAQGENKKIEQEEEEQPQPDNDLRSFFIKNKMLILLIVLAVAVLAMIALFVRWIVKERKKTAMRIASFEDEDVAKGICNIFDYVIDSLLAWGITPQKGLLMVHLPEINRLLGEDCTEQYKNTVELRQEARYSNHTMTEENRESVRAFKDKVCGKMWKEAGFIDKLKYKYMYFL